MNQNYNCYVTKKITFLNRYEYSLNPNPWTWLESREAAEEMALQVVISDICKYLKIYKYLKSDFRFTRLPIGSNMGRMVSTWTWRLELGTNRSENISPKVPSFTIYIWSENISPKASSFSTDQKIFLHFKFHYFLFPGCWCQHVLLHWETSQLCSRFHHHPTHIWISTGGLKSKWFRWEIGAETSPQLWYLFWNWVYFTTSTFYL